MSQRSISKPNKKIVPNKKSGASFSFFNGYILPSIIIFIFVFIVFSKSITNIFIALDDQVYILDNPYIKSLSWQNIKDIFSTFYNGNYHPITTLLYAIEYKVFGKDASYYHIISLLIHVINSCLVFTLLRKLNLKAEFSFIGALIFAIHPMHVESVVWISEQKDVLYSMFYIAGLITYINYSRNKKLNYLFQAFLLFLFSLLSKSAAVTFPLVILTIDLYNKRLWNTRNIIEKIPFLALSLVFGIVSILSQNAAGAINDATMVTYSPFQRIFVVSFSILYYIGKFIIPFDLCILHYAPKELPVYFYLCPLIILLIVMLVWKSKLLQRPLIFGLLFYLFSVILVVQIIPIGYVLVSERYSYIPYIGLIFILGNIYSLIKENKISFADSINKYLNYILSLLVLIFSFISYQYIYKWQNSVLLFTDITEKNPGSGFAFYSLGKVQNVSGFPMDAIKSFDTAVKLDSTIAEAYFCRGNIYLNQKNYDLAEKDFLKAEILKKDYPDNYNNLAFLYSENNQMGKAILYYSKAIEYKPSEYLFQRRATCYTFVENYQKALEDYDMTIKINPSLVEPYFNRGVCYYHVQKIDKACDDWKHASSLGYTKADALLAQFCK